MGEPESLDTDEPLPQRIARHDFDRLIMLSDGVFAIAITLLALEIKPPEQWNGQILDLLARTWRSLFGFGLSFLIVGFFWMAHKRLMARIRRVDAAFAVLTLLLLAFVVMAPVVTELVATHGPVKAMKIYAGFVAGAGLVQALLWAYAAFVRDLFYAEVTRVQRWVGLAALATIPPMFALTAVLAKPGAGATVFIPIILLVLSANLLRRWLVRRHG